MVITRYFGNSGDFDYDVATSGIPGVSYVHQFGENLAIDATLAEDVWANGGLYPFQTSAQSLEILSTNTNDNSTGTGARTVIVFGLDSSWQPQQENVTLNGTSTVALSNTYIRVFRAFVVSAGSSDINEGDIIVRVAGGGDPQALIPAFAGQTPMAIFTIPDGKIGFLRQWYAASVGNMIGSVKFSIISREENMSFKVEETITLANGGGPWQRDVPSLTRFLGRTDILIRAEVTINGTSVTGGFDIILKDA